MSLSTHALFLEAQRYIPGGVNSPVRAFRGVGGDPVFFSHAEGAYLFDVNNKRYIDFVGSWGPMIVGHAHPEVIKAVQAMAAKGLSFGAPTALETDMARKICELMPSIEQVRMVNSGTEATMTAIRLARGYTKRDKIIKFEGCYHGHVDALLVKAGSGALTLGVPTSAGIPAAVAEQTITLSYNNLAQVQQVFAQMGEQIAAIIVEPVAGNMNCVLPVAGFLPGLRELCSQYGSVLIFDEVMTGFRVSLGGAQAYYQITPDLTTLGKVIGGGLPVGALGGKRDIMQQLAPLGPVYQAGTLSGNPLAMVAGLTTLKLLEQPHYIDNAILKTQQLTQGIAQLANASGIPVAINQAGAMFGLFFTAEPSVTTYEQVMAADVACFRKFFHALLEAGIYLAPSAFEAGFVSTAHSDEDIVYTLQAVEQALSQCR